MKEQDLNCDDGSCETTTDNLTQIKNKEQEDANKLIYVGDPMCSWCWGITNHLEKLKEEYADQFKFELILGGLRPGGGEEWNEDFRKMIRSHWEHVQEASGQPFDFEFFNGQQFNYDTEPSSRAVRVVRDMDSNKEWPFYKRLQQAFYAENQDVHDLKTYQMICEFLNLDYASFETLFLSPDYKQLTHQDFVKAQQMGVRGFPAVVLQKGDQYYAVSMGYSDYEKMKATLEQILVT